MFKTTHHDDHFATLASAAQRRALRRILGRAMSMVLVAALAMASAENLALADSPEGDTATPPVELPGQAIRPGNALPGSLRYSASGSRHTRPSQANPVTSEPENPSSLLTGRLECALCDHPWLLWGLALGVFKTIEQGTAPVVCTLENALGWNTKGWSTMTPELIRCEHFDLKRADEEDDRRNEFKLDLDHFSVKGTLHRDDFDSEEEIQRVLSGLEAILRGNIDLHDQPRWNDFGSVVKPETEKDPCGPWRTDQCQSRSPYGGRP